jgi:hypothetical protein
MQFTIRELLLVTVIVGMGVGWWLEYRQSAHIKRLLDVVEIEAKQSRMAINTMYADLDGIEQSLQPYGLTLSWSNDLRPSVQHVLTKTNQPRR